MRKNLFATVLTIALLALAPTAAVLAQEAATEEMETTLTGQLAGDAESGYTLTEQESGDEVVLQGEVDFASHVGSSVKVTGTWANDAEGNRYLEVSGIEAAEAAPEAEA